MSRENSYAPLNSDARLNPNLVDQAGAADGDVLSWDDGAGEWAPIAPGAASHPNLAAHDALGLATDAELGAHTGDATDAHDASAISFTPTGGLAADDVQEALEELDTEKEVAGTTATHIADASDAHDASAVSYDNTGSGLTADQVQEAIDELDATIDALPGGHDPVTLGADAGAILGLTGQQIDLDVQNANKVLAGPTSGGDADPAFRALVDADIPSAIARDSELHTEDHDHDGSPTQKLTQANTHESPDTDTATTALHHTLGTGANQAAAGNDARLSDARAVVGENNADYASIAINDTNLVVIHSVTGLTVAAGTLVEFEAEFIIFNNSTAARTYSVEIALSSLSTELIDGTTQGTHATNGAAWFVKGSIRIVSSSLAYVALEFRRMDPLAASTANSQTNANLRKIWNTSASDQTGVNKTAQLRIKSSAATATQTLKLIRSRIRVA
jgi:hypothetical protein